jgi:acetyl-CoA carboxylase biotin carboxyl carrier protein
MAMKGMKSIGAMLTGKAEVDADAIRKLSALLDETGLAEIEIEQNGARIRVARHMNGSGGPTIMAPVVQTVPAAPVAAESAKGSQVGGVTSPMVGTVYVAPEPGSQPFVKVGQTVKEGDTLFIVEAMKTMNPITAPHGGVVTEICVKDAQPVEFGQVLIVIS